MTRLTGKMQALRDHMDPARAGALCVALGHGGAPIEAGTPLPPFFHHVYFWQVVPEGQLGRDGHPAPGAGTCLIPETGLPRRMWAGGSLRFHAPLIAGIPAVRVSRVAGLSRKTGRSGPLVFVTLAHEIRQGGRLCLTEAQELVYRPPANPTAPRPVAPEAADDPPGTEAIGFSTTLLFRYSALTMNGHRIHYDADYAREVEGYGGLVVHGPLLAQLLMLKAARELGPLAGFRFRATAPLVQGETAMLCREGRRLWVRGPKRRLCMEAEVLA